MFKNYLKMLSRLWWRDKLTTGVNILGLAIGLAFSFVIILYVTYEKSYNRFHRNSDRVYRVITRNVNTGYYSAITPVNLNDKLLAEFPEIEHAGQAVSGGPVLVEHGNQSFSEDRFLVTDAGFLETLTFPLAAGDVSTALQQPLPVLITENMAQKYFPDMDPLGKNLTISEGGRNEILTVAGILKNIPVQSHLQMDFIAPVRDEIISLDSDIGVVETINYRSNIFHTYVMLRQGVDPDAVEKNYRILLRAASGHRMSMPIPTTCNRSQTSICRACMSINSWNRQAIPGRCSFSPSLDFSSYSSP